MHDASSFCTVLSVYTRTEYKTFPVLLSYNIFVGNEMAFLDFVPVVHGEEFRILSGK